MKEYNKPEIVIEDLEIDDVICSSGLAITNDLGIWGDANAEEMR